MRGRRLRSNVQIRKLVQETRLHLEDFIYPLFIVEGKNKKEEITSMPGIYRFSIDELLKEMEELIFLGIKNVLFFGIPEYKDKWGSSAYCKDNIVSKAIRAVKEKHNDVYIIADVCLCEYTSHGHCGVVDCNNTVNNDETLPLLAQASISYAQAGADMIAPSDMMDSRIGYIRSELDKAGFIDIPIMSYSAKYCSAFYGPFREAADSAPQFGDRRTYQMDSSNKKEAIKEIMADIEEGADIVMVKPALPYLDVIQQAAQITHLPICAYQVSGEYAMIQAADKMDWIDGKRAAIESLTAIKRAGADMIITYFAKDFALGKLNS